MWLQTFLAFNVKTLIIEDSLFLLKDLRQEQTSWVLLTLESTVCIVRELTVRIFL
jgi:hypothetical protein